MNIIFGNIIRHQVSFPLKLLGIYNTKNIFVIYLIMITKELGFNTLYLTYTISEQVHFTLSHSGACFSFPWCSDCLLQQTAVPTWGAKSPQFSYQHLPEVERA